MKPCTPPSIIEHLVIRREITTSTGGGNRGASIDVIRYDSGPAVDIINFLHRNVIPERQSALARTIGFIVGDEPLPRTVTGLTRRTGVSRNQLWRDLRALGLPKYISPLVLLRAALVWRVVRETETPGGFANALTVLGCARNDYVHAVAFVNRAVGRSQFLSKGTIPGQHGESH